MISIQNYLKTKYVEFKKNRLFRWLFGVVMAPMVLLVIYGWVIFIDDNFTTNYYIFDRGTISPIVNNISLVDKENSKSNINILSVKARSRGVFQSTIYMALLDIKGEDYTPREIGENSEDMGWESLQDRYQSYNAAYIAAAKLAGKPVSYVKKVLYTENGFQTKDSPFKRFDQIVEINNQSIDSCEKAVSLLKDLKDKVILFKIKRDNKELYLRATTKDLGNKNPALINWYEIHNQNFFKSQGSDNEGGPSGGLMSAIYFYYKLIGKDLGSSVICGTGTIDDLGQVGPIGGVKLKASAADSGNAVLMFIPVGKNYVDARSKLDKLNSNVILCPVRTLKEAVDLLEEYKKAGKI